MEVPPPYVPQRPKSNKSLWIVLAIIAVVIMVPCVAIVGLGVAGVNMMKPMLGCVMSFSAVSDAMDEYVHDHHGLLPKASTWQDDLIPYYEEQMKHSKGSPFSGFDGKGEWSCDNPGGVKTGFAFNSAVSEKKRADLEGTTVIIFETPEVGKNQAKPYKALDKSDSPRIFGEHRGWFKIYPDGFDESSASKIERRRSWKSDGDSKDKESESPKSSESENE